MYLYNRNGKVLEVYKLIPKEKIITEYKKEQMQLIPDDERVLRAISNCELFPLKNANIFDISQVVFHDRFFQNNYHYFEKYKKNEKNSAEKIVEDYYANFDDKRTVMVVDRHKTYYYLLNDDFYCKDYRFFRRNRFIMNDIISMPKSLYILQNMYFGNGLNLYDMDISEQAELFEFISKPCEYFSIDRIETFKNLGLIENTFNDDILENNQELVKRLLKLNNQK